MPLRFLVVSINALFQNSFQQKFLGCNFLFCHGYVSLPNQCFQQYQSPFFAKCWLLMCSFWPLILVMFHRPLIVGFVCYNIRNFPSKKSNAFLHQWSCINKCWLCFDSIKKVIGFHGICRVWLVCSNNYDLFCFFSTTTSALACIGDTQHTFGSGSGFGPPGEMYI